MNLWIFIYRFSWSILAVLAFAALITAFAPPIRQFRELQHKQAQLEEEVRLEEEMLKYLKTKQERLLNDPRFVEKIAREELGLAKPGETIFKFVDDATNKPASLAK